MRSIQFAVLALFIGIAIGYPLKDDIDELASSINDLRHQNSDLELSGKTTNNAATHRGKRAAVDLERNPLLYDYYTGVYNSIYDKKNADEIDRALLEKWLKNNYDSNSFSDGHQPYGKRNFDEIDRANFSGFKKSLPYIGNNLHNEKRNFDEIDRVGFNGFQKKNFDEIDRVGFRNFKKRNFDEIDRVGFHNFQKKNFDEIDRVGFHRFKREV